jgi:outer membrane receptor protein involved in Fe transport
VLKLWQTSLLLTSVFCVLDIPAVLAEVADDFGNAQMLVQSPTPSIITITGVKANPTEKGVEVILETSFGDKLQVANRSTGNNFIADIAGGQLRLANGDAFTFRSEKPITGITEITVTNIDANTIRVTVVGEKALPVVELFDDKVGLVFTVFNPIYGRSPTTTVIGSFGESGLRQQTNSLGIYLQDQVALQDNLKFLLGGRFDFIDRKYEDLINNTESSGSDSAFSPRFGIVYQPIPAISLYGSYTSSFTPPGGSYFFGVDSSFEPERGNQYEVGIKADFNEQLSATLSLFDLTRTNVTTADPNDPNVSIQVGEQNSRGVELNLAGEILPGWNIFAGYAYVDARITEDNTLIPGSRLSNSANNSFNIWTSYEIQKGNLQGLGAGIGLFYVGDRANFDNTYDVPSYLRTDASIFYNRDKFRAALNFKNLFDIEYFESSLGNRVYYGQPFTVQGTVSWQF